MDTPIALNMSERIKAGEPSELLRPPAYHEGIYPWNLGRVPPKLGDTIHPGRSCAIFVVHGMGREFASGTAVRLRSGFEDALEAILSWQREQQKWKGIQPETSPPPFVYGGYWADYGDLQKTFPEDWSRFNEREREFFSQLWKKRAFSKTRAFFWFLKQQFRLLRWGMLREVGPLVYILYWPLQVVLFAALVFALIRHPQLITDFLSDVRLYLDPQGLVERAIVQRIDYRVGQEFLRMIGLDWDFQPLPEDKRIEASGERFVFEIIVWVAHSLGSVISYNVLSDLFVRADEFEKTGDAKQKEGVRRFRTALRRFVTTGSPLDKVAFLFKDRSLRPWPKDGRGRRAFLQGGETLQKGDPPELQEWWINFYHVLDPVSGALSSPYICVGQRPCNIHILAGILNWIMPALAHVAYWKDLGTLRFILGRTYGKEYLHDQEYKPLPPETLAYRILLGYFVWAAILIVGAYAIITYVIVKWSPVLTKLINLFLVKFM
ncbi:MAG: hypothetical protein Q7T05_05570 [Dehalococcoidia bacterium]|nr:hypothetical protein [Dehalococcoidia bacterium]